MKKRILIFVVCAVAAISFICGCGAGKTFEKAGMQITLTNNFYEKEYISMTAYYESQDAIVTALKEDFKLMDGLSEYTVEQYTNLVLKNNSIIAEKLRRENKEYIFFTYEKSVSGKDFYYLATTHKGTDAFWLIQFACTVENKNQMTDTFLKWADSVKFVSPANA